MSTRSRSDCVPTNVAPDVGDGDTLPCAHAEQLDLILQATNEGLWDWNLTTNDVEFSPRWKEMLGYAAHELPDRFESWEQRVHPDDLPAARSAIGAYLSGGSPIYEIEHRLQHRDGSYRWICARGVAVRDRSGTAVRFVGSHTDLTEQKAAEQELRRRDTVLEAVRFAAERFLTPTGSWDQSVTQVLERLGRATGVSRVYIFENYAGPDGEIWGTNTHEWVVSPGLSVIDLPQLKALSYRDIGFGRWVDILRRGQTLHGHTRDLPEVERRELESEGILSIVLVPIFVDGEWWGLIGFDECARERDFSAIERDALKAAADTLGAAIGRSRAEAASSQLAAIVASSNDAIIGEALDGTITSWNPGAERLYGYSAEEIVGRHIGVLVPSGEAPRLPDVLAADARGERLPHFETVRLKKDGTPVDVSIAFSLVRDASGAIIGAAAITRDITREKRAERELRESQRAMQTLLANLPGMAYRIPVSRMARDREPDIGPDIVSQGAFDLTGYPPDQLAGIGGFSYTDIIHPGDHEAMQGEIKSAIYDRRPYHLSYRITTASGDEKWVMEQGRPVQDTQGEIVALEGIILDVTGRIRADQELRESQRAMQTLLSNLPGMAYRCRNDADGRMEFVSEGAFDLTGYRPDTLTADRGVAYVDLISPDDRARVWHEIQAAVTSDAPFRTTYRITTKLGVQKWVMEQGRAVRDSAGEVVALEGIIMDVTDRVEARHELERRVEERTRELGTLLSISTSVASTLELQPLLRIVLDQLGQVVDHSAAAIFALGGDDTLRLLDYRGPTEHAELEWTWRLSDAPHSRAVIENRAPVIISDVHADTPMAAAFRQKAISDLGAVPSYIASWMGVPLMLRDRAVGLLAMDSAEPNAYTMRHAELALAFASQAAVAIENARLYAAAQGTAALQERQRLARELHDSVSQALFGIGLGARTARTLVETDPERAAAPIDYVLTLAEAGLAEMRALIFELRPEALEEEGLVAALRKQVAALQGRYGISVEATLPDSLDLSQPVQEAIYRIAQEALHNIVKHARASDISVTVERGSNAVTLTIIDDGIGFDTTGSFPGHLGLKTMSERAGRLGGTFRLASAPGNGATIEVSIPISVR